MGRITLKQAVDFHGHLGPYLVLGILAGEAAIKKLNCRKYFGLEVKVSGAADKPKSCLVDGLQLSTGATYGKGNIKKIAGKNIKILFRNCEDNKKIALRLDKNLLRRLDGLKGHSDSEILAKELYKKDTLNGTFSFRYL
ncbi:MAG: FmdE family protein [Deltaproteobacteria bacterium]